MPITHFIIIILYIYISIFYRDSQRILVTTRWGFKKVIIIIIIYGLERQTIIVSIFAQRYDLCVCVR